MPQLAWSTWNSAVSASSFFALELGWDQGPGHPIWFWFKNTGFFIPLLMVAALLKSGWLSGAEAAVVFLSAVYALLHHSEFHQDGAVDLGQHQSPLLLVARFGAVSRFAVGEAVARRSRFARTVAIILFVVVTLAGTLDVAGIVFRSTDYNIFDASGIAFAELVKEKTPPRALIIHAPVHNTPVFLTGRRSLMGYPGHIWTHGLEFMQRETEIKRIYLGTPDADQLMRKHGVDYAVIGPLERLVVRVNDEFFSRFEKVGQVGEYSLYKIRQE